MTPPCYNRPPRLEGMLMPTGELARTKYVAPGRLVRRMRWVPAFSADRCSQHDGGGVGPNGECYADAQGYECAGCRWEPEHVKAKREANPLPGILKVIEENNLRPATFDLLHPELEPPGFDLGSLDLRVGEPPQLGVPVRMPFWGDPPETIAFGRAQASPLPQEMSELQRQLLDKAAWPTDSYSRTGYYTKLILGEAGLEGHIAPLDHMYLGFDPASGPDQTAYWPAEAWKDNPNAGEGHAAHCNLMFPATLNTEDDHCDCKPVDKPVHNAEVIHMFPRQAGKTAALARALSDTRDMVDHLTGLRPSEMRSSPAFAKGGAAIPAVMTQAQIEWLNSIAGSEHWARLAREHYAKIAPHWMVNPVVQHLDGCSYLDSPDLDAPCDCGSITRFPPEVYT